MKIASSSRPAPKSKLKKSLTTEPNSDNGKERDPPNQRRPSWKVQDRGQPRVVLHTGSRRDTPLAIFTAVMAAVVPAVSGVPEINWWLSAESSPKVMRNVVPAVNAHATPLKPTVYSFCTARAILAAVAAWAATVPTP